MKVNKEEYGFVEGPINCANCGFWQGNRTCKLVKGHISENGICMLWTKNGNEVHEQEFTKEESLYQEPTSRCGICYFYKDNSCELVEGHIGEEDCCIAFKAKEDSIESFYGKIFKMVKVNERL